MGQPCGDAPFAPGAHARTRASLDEALADEELALAGLVHTRAGVAPEQAEILDELIARKRQIVAALRALRVRLGPE